MIHHKFNKKIISRLAVVQFIYQKFFIVLEGYKCNTTSSSMNLEEAQKFLNSFYQDPQTIWSNYLKQFSFKSVINVKYFTSLILLITNNLPYIDGIIYSKCKNKLDKIDLLVGAILRTAICELKYINKVPFKVIINEYTNLANDLLDHYHVGFVNFILDAYAKERDKKLLC